jgi:lipopolysaccharide/colanic/teichoic acid biosynthesis glycosyltransferase
MLKRAIDMAVAGTALALIAPLLGLTAVAVRLTHGTPVLFRQPRPGLHGRTFEVLKFRTMREAVRPDGSPLPDSQRITGFGHFLRQTSLDELPQLWNVLRGDMSLVGPRPLLLEYLPLYSPEQARRHDVRPGITGWAQVNGRNGLSWEEKFRLDVWYVENRSLALDAKILFLTMWTVARRKGIGQPGMESVEPFRGSQGR